MPAENAENAQKEEGPTGVLKECSAQCTHAHNELQLSLGVMLYWLRAPVSSTGESKQMRQNVHATRRAIKEMRARLQELQKQFDTVIAGTICTATVHEQT